jgi:predicted aspartyl protease
LTFPVSPDGLIVPVWIGLSGQVLANLMAAGQAAPPPIAARGLIDTGSDVTAVDPSLLRALGATPATLTTTTTTASGQVRVRLFEVSLSITDPTQSLTAWLTEPNLLVTELPLTLPAVGVLVGLDVLLTCKLQLDGPARLFALDF